MRNLQIATDLGEHCFYRDIDLCDHPHITSHDEMEHALVVANHLQANRIGDYLRFLTRDDYAEFQKLTREYHDENIIQRRHQG